MSDQPLTELEKLALDYTKLRLQASRVDLAAREVIRSARLASKGQDLVLRSKLLHLAREVGEPLNTA